MKTFNAVIVDKRCFKLTVEADSVEDAKHTVEASNDAVKEFGGKMIFNRCEWYIEGTEEEI